VEEGKVQICTMCDNGEMTIGEKRNRLLSMSTGEYVAFIDDDDAISPDYIQLIINAIEDTKPDCIGIKGMMSVIHNNVVKSRRFFYHTIENNTYYESNRGYERPPNHLNPIKRDIAIKYEFKDISMGEDTDWAMQICNNVELKTEKYIDKTIYFYNFNPLK
jgi:glycosyltransferase involved in cell wall biosynthesis